MSLLIAVSVSSLWLLTVQLQRADAGVEQLPHHTTRRGCRQQAINDDRVSIDLGCVARVRLRAGSRSCMNPTFDRRRHWIAAASNCTGLIWPAMDAKAT